MLRWIQTSVRLTVAVSADAPEPLLAAADYRLRDPAAVETLLTWLVGEVAAGTSR